MDFLRGGENMDFLRGKKFATAVFVIMAVLLLALALSVFLGFGK